MTLAIAPHPIDSTQMSSVAGAHAWRPFPRAVADILCVEEAPGDLNPRMYASFALTVSAARAVVRTESGRSVVAEPGSILLVPAWHLYALRVLERVPDGSITLLLGASCLEGVGATERPALVTDGSLAAQMAALVAELRRPVRLLESGNGIRATLERLVARGMPLTVARPRRAVANLAPVREHLRAHLGEPVTTAELADLSGRTAWHLIRTFHREFGLPPHAYQMRLRVAAAGGLLSAGIGVSSAAYECGFADQSHLSRTFKEVYGLTPAAWAAAAARGPRHGAPADAPRPGAGSPPPATRIRHPLMIAARAARS